MQLMNLNIDEKFLKYLLYSCWKLHCSVIYKFRFYHQRSLAEMLLFSEFIDIELGYCRPFIWYFSHDFSSTIFHKEVVIYVLS